MFSSDSILSRSSSSALRGYCWLRLLCSALAALFSFFCSAWAWLAPLVMPQGALPHHCLLCRTNLQPSFHFTSNISASAIMVAHGNQSHLLVAQRSKGLKGALLAIPPPLLILLAEAVLALRAVLP